MQHYDAVIAGAGIIGSACAYYLARQGAKVLLLDRSSVNSGASSRNAGSLHFQLEYRLIQNPQLLENQLPFLLPLTLQAIELWKSLPSELGADIGLQMGGGLMVAETPEQCELLHKKSEIERRCGLTVEWLTGAQARALEPNLSHSIEAALLCPEEGSCNPRLLTPAFVSKAIELGAQVIDSTAVVALSRNSDGWTVTAENVKSKALRRVFAPVVVNACGAWSAELALRANVHLPVFPVALMMSVTEAAPQMMARLIQHVGKKLSLKQVSDGNVLVGGGWSAKLRESAFQGGDADIINEQLVANLSVAAEVMPNLRKLNLIRTWTGITGITQDHLPVVGQYRQAPGFYTAAGGSGFTYGPSYARLLAEYIGSGIEPELLKPYSPDRFNDLNMFMGS